MLTSLFEPESDSPDEARLRILKPLRTAEVKLARKKSAIDPKEGLDPTESEDENSREDTGTQG